MRGLPVAEAGIRNLMARSSIPEVYALFRDSFLPPRLRHLSQENPGERALFYKTRRMISLLLVISSATLVTMLVQLAQSLLFSGLGAAFALGLLLLGLLSLRRGASLSLVGVVFVGAATVVGVVLGLIAGPNGLSSLFWVALAPTIALSITNIRVARVVFGLVAVVLAASTWLMFSQTYVPLVDASREAGAHIGSLLGAMTTYFFLSWAHERETDFNIAELERKNEALLEARRVAEAASRSKGEFLAAMSHEIRTPMNGVLGMTSVMLSGDLPEPVREGLLTIRQSGDALLVLLNDILDLSRIEAGKLTLEQVPCDVAAEVKGIGLLLATSGQERGNTLAVQIEPSVTGYLRCDPLRFRQIVLNLVSNSLKFTQNGRVSLTLSFDQSTLCLTVNDTGIGMEPEVISRIFEPFRQGDSSTTRRYGGSGLGLAIVRQLVTAMKGRVSVESEPGRGSTFTVHIPAEVCDPPDRSSEKIAAAPVRRLRVLLVEDNATNRKVAALLLRNLGHEVLLAENGVRAVEISTQEKPDLILMDCHMPEMDGFEATRQIRAGDLHLPIIALTAASTPEEQQRCLTCGMSAVLLKPIDRFQLQLAIAQHAGGL
jgi:signal transduction histidine kinase